MINTIADLLEEFKQFALAKIEKEESDIKHRVTIGEMFEGVTQELLSKAIFQGLDLRVVQRSFIYNDAGTLSDEMDCLLVIGEGEKISFSDRYRYHIKDVIAVFQIKKNLYANDIDDSHQNLLSVLDVSIPRTPEPFVGRLHRDAYRALVRKELPFEGNVPALPDKEKIAFHLLRLEAFHPLRIVIGYHGYSSEYTLREGFFKKLDQILNVGLTRGYNPISFPNLYICGDKTIIKNNGMPMGKAFTDQPFYWNILLSASGKPMYHLLELIWTRLSYKFEIGSHIFGDDFEYEPMHPFLSCREKKLDLSSWGWEYQYHYLTKKQLSIPISPMPWKPHELDASQFLILKFLEMHGNVEISDHRFEDMLTKNNLDFEAAIKGLAESGLIYLDGTELGLLVDELNIYIAGDGKIYGGENKSGEMINYFMKQSFK